VFLDSRAIVRPLDITRAGQLDADRAFALVIDVQEKLTPLVRDHRRVVDAVCRLLRGVRIFSVPIVVTEQYPRGIGPTVTAVTEWTAASGATLIEKPTFSAWAHAAARGAIVALDRPQAILVGIESHVCVQQTALDLRSRDYDVFVCADAIGARGAVDHDLALERMRREGVCVTSVESVLFELCGRCDAPRFKDMLEVIKSAPAGAGDVSCASAD